MADVNIVVALEVESEATAGARELARLDSDWRLPPLWRAEFSNVVRNLHRAGRIRREEALDLLASCLERYSDAEIPVDEPSALALAMDLDLTFYDASYLELALRFGVPLVTEDKELQRKSQGHAESLSRRLARHTS